MRVVGDVLLLVVCVFRHVDVVCIQLQFRVICSLFTCVSVAGGAHLMEAYSNMGLVLALFVVSSASLYFPRVDEYLENL